MTSRKTPERSPSRQTAPRLSLAVQYASAARNLPTRTQLRRWVKAALQRDAAMTLRIVDEEEGLQLNKSYRRKNYPTNVLTFVYDDTDSLYGDAVICAPVVEKEAAEQHKDLSAHYAHLVIHAVLHLQGYDHENDTDAVAMETTETAIMLKLSYPDPYQESSNTHGRSSK
jgi:probable rRNA maturation factor